MVNVAFHQTSKGLTMQCDECKTLLFMKINTHTAVLQMKVGENN